MQPPDALRQIDSLRQSPPVLPPEPTSAEMVEATRILWQIFDLLNHWIKNSDTKAAAVLSANAILANAAVSTFGRVSGFDEAFLVKHPVVLGLDLLALTLALVSVGFTA